MDAQMQDAQVDVRSQIGDAPSNDAQMGLLFRWWSEVRRRIRSLNGDVSIGLGDLLGGNRWSLRNSSDAEVFGVDSTGQIKSGLFATLGAAKYLITDALGNLTAWRWEDTQATPVTVVTRDANGVVYANQYHAEVYSTVTTSCAHGGWTPVSFDSAYAQFGAVWSNTYPTRLYAPVTGLYHIVGNVTWTANATGDRGVAIRKNGGVFVAAVFHATVLNEVHMVVSKVLSLSAGDYLEVMAYQTSGAALNLFVQSGLSPEATLVAQ